MMLHTQIRLTIDVVAHPLLHILSGKPAIARGEPQHVMVVDHTGTAIAPEQARPSAETLLHTLIYSRFAETAAVLHTHSVNATVLSLQHEGELVLQGFELLKGLADRNAHDVTEVVPILANSQDMRALAAQAAMTAWFSEGAHSGRVSFTRPICS